MESPHEIPPVYPPKAAAPPIVGSAVDPVANTAAEAKAESYNPSPHQIFLTRVQTAALCYAVFLAGFNDGSLGPLLPRIQHVYNVSTPRPLKRIKVNDF
jgi:hypothetical protein